MTSLNPDQSAGGMTVWVVEPVGYNQYGIYGIFDSLEAAKASYDSGWHQEKNGSWTSDDANAVSEVGVTIYEYVVRRLGDS